MDFTLIGTAVRIDGIAAEPQSDRRHRAGPGIRAPARSWYRTRRHRDRRPLLLAQRATSPWQALGQQPVHQPAVAPARHVLGGRPPPRACRTRQGRAPPGNGVLAHTHFGQLFEARSSDKRRPLSRPPHRHRHGRRHASGGADVPRIRSPWSTCATSCRRCTAAPLPQRLSTEEEEADL